MIQVYHIARKEFRDYFTSTIGYVFLTLILFVTGFSFYGAFQYYAQISSQQAMNPMMGTLPSFTEVVFGSVIHLFAVIALFISPMLTMRLIAEERRQHTLELLMTSPVSSGEIVLGKFLGSFGFFTVSLVLTLHYPILMSQIGSPDLGPIATSYLGTLLVGGACIAVGLLVSSMTRHQIAAAAAAFILLLVMWIIDWVDVDFLSKLSLSKQYEGFVEGYVRSESIVYFLSVIVFFLFATQQRLEAMRRQ